jgi:hypothetical protein
MKRLAFVLLFALTACGGPPVALDGRAAGPAEFTPVGPQSLEKWAAFPVDANPRPLVLLGDPVRVEKGFADGDAKMAFEAGLVDPDGKVPPEAAQAFAALTLEKPLPAPQPPKLKVLSATHATASFGTDRGPKELPAWIFMLSDALGPIAVLDLKPEWRSFTSGPPQRVSADGLTLTLTLPKAAEPCPGEPRITYQAQFLESKTAVAVGLKQETGTKAPGERGNCAHDLVMRFAEYPVKLSQPLGNRVLVDAQGNAMPVLTP